MSSIVKTAGNVAGSAIHGVGAAARQVVEWAGRLVSLIVSGVKATGPLAVAGATHVARALSFIATGSLSLVKSAAGYVPVAFQATKHSVTQHPVAYGVVGGLFAAAVVGLVLAGGTGAAGYAAYNKWFAKTDAVVPAPTGTTGSPAKDKAPSVDGPHEL